MKVRTALPATMTKRLRIAATVAIVAVALLSLAAKFYRGPGDEWVNNWGPASVGYVLFFCLVALWLFPRRSMIPAIVVLVFALTCLVEFLQLYQPPWLQTMRATFLGRMVLGTSFSWWDFSAYICGAIAAWFLLQWLASRFLPTAPDA